MFLEKLSKKDVVRALRSTKSRDPEVLLAKKEEMLSENRRFNYLVTLGYVGLLLSITFVLAPIGLPLCFVGFSVQKTSLENKLIIDSEFRMYLSSLDPGGAYADLYQEL